MKRLNFLCVAIVFSFLFTSSTVFAVPGITPPGEALVLFTQAWFDDSPHVWAQVVDLYTARTDGSSVRRLTGGRGNNFPGSWLPDGKSFRKSGVFLK